MKTQVVATTLFATVVIALAVVSQFVALTAIAGIPVCALIGGLASAALLVFAFNDYSRKPSFRIRRTPATTPASSSTGTGDTYAAQLDWTYATRAA